MKAVIVIDVDENKIGNEVNYISIGDTVLYIGKKVRVKPLPERKETMYGWQYYGLIEEYRKEGWNACLDEITGETE